MTLVRRLKQEARAGATYRKHDMTRFVHVKSMSGNDVYTSECKICGMYVQVTPDPEPNGIDIGGTAVALNCGSPE